MNKPIVVLKLIRNTLIALVSIGWLLPLQGSVAAFFYWFYHCQQPNYDDCVGGDFNIQMSLFLFRLASVWLAVVIIFWTFVAANKLWPVKGKKAKEAQET